MELIQELLDEKRKWEISKLAGVSYDMTRMREVARELKHWGPKTFPLDVDGSDFDLINSIIRLERKVGRN